MRRVGYKQLLSGHWCCYMLLCIYLLDLWHLCVTPVHFVRHMRLVKALSACAIVRTKYVCVVHICGFNFAVR